VLTGVYTPDAGEVRLAGQPIRAASPRDAERLGISTVYQEVNLIPSLSVAENIGLGRQPGKFGFLNWGALRRHARAALARLEIELDVDTELGSLPLAIQQIGRHCRALDLQAKLLVLDEPTASLDEKEVEELVKIMRQLRAAGLGIVFVTHFLDQVYEISDRITVLRNGELVGEYATAELGRLQLVSKMLGREVSDEEGMSPEMGISPPREKSVKRNNGSPSRSLPAWSTRCGASARFESCAGATWLAWRVCLAPGARKPRVCSLALTVPTPAKSNCAASR